MANPLKAAYKNGGEAPSVPATAPTTPVPVSVPLPAAQPVQVQTTTFPPTPARDLSALRAKLAGGFVNPPETGDAVNEDTLAPRTVETADGGAAAAPGWVEAKNGLVVRAPADPGPGSEATASPTTELSRGQKAAATRAANKAAKAPPVAAVGAPEPSDTSEGPVAASSVAYSLKDVSTDDLLAEIYKRVAARFA